MKSELENGRGHAFDLACLESKDQVQVVAILLNRYANNTYKWRRIVEYISNNIPPSHFWHALSTEEFYLEVLLLG